MSKLKMIESVKVRGLFVTTGCNTLYSAIYWFTERYTLV